MSELRIHDKNRNVTYVYENQSYWDKEKKQARAKRKLIGKVDPETGEVIPTGKVGRPKSSKKNNQELPPPEIESLKKRCIDAESKVAKLEKDVREMRKLIRSYEAALKGLKNNLSQKVLYLEAVLDEK